MLSLPAETSHHAARGPLCAPPPLFQLRHRKPHTVQQEGSHFQRHLRTVTRTKTTSQD